MRFLPYTQLASVPNVIVDGAPTDTTVLTLSHWPKSGTPAELKGDTSTAIVFNYLDAPRFHGQHGEVSNSTKTSSWGFSCCSNPRLPFILGRVEEHLRTGAPAWNPYD